ncbi:MAG: hypothetical protein GY928_22230 [Colwellia sp.]|nr:hypothetical protein [Colwellia sp.]
MNRLNAVRQVLAKLKKYCKNPLTNSDRYSVLTNMYYDIKGSDIDYCNKCCYDDFGYCYHRNTTLSDEEVFNCGCCKQMIKALENELNKKRLIK